MMIDHDLKIAYFGIPKAAGSSMKHALFQLFNGTTWQRDTAYGDLPPVSHIHLHYPSLKWDQIDHDAIKGYWKFAIVRDPIGRILSAYGNKVIDQRVMHKQAPPKRWWAGNHRAYVKLEKDPDLNTFVVHLAQYRKAMESIRRHTMCYGEFLGKDLGYFDKIYPIEKLNQLAKDLSERTGKPVEFPHRNKTKTRFEVAALSPAAHKSIARYTKADYRLLHDFYDVPPVG